MTDLNIYKELQQLQKELKAPKDQDGRFGKSRSAEKILEALKPLTAKHSLTLIISDEIIQVGNRNYVKATATIFDTKGTSISSTANAWEGEINRGLDASQVTGMASSYARKYALGGLFAIDDSKDADTHTDSVEMPVKIETEFASLKQRQLIADKLAHQGITQEQTAGYLIEQYGVTIPLTKEGAAFVIDDLLGN